MFGAVDSPELQPLDGATHTLLAIDPAVLDGETAAQLLVELRRVTARLAAVQARLVDTAEREQTWVQDGFRSTANWLASSDNTSVDGARNDVRLARRLRSMPATAVALAAGDITVDHAHRLATLAGPDTAAAFATAEEFLVGQARTMRWADFVKACAYWLREARDKDPDPDKADRDHRYVSLHDGLRGTGLLEGELTAVGKATVRSALERIERELFEADWAAAKAVHGEAVTSDHLGRTTRQRRHDALVEMAVRAAAAATDGKRPRPLVSVLVGYDAFHNICELADGTLLGDQTVADLFDDAVVERIVFDGPSRVTDLGQARSFTGAARRAVEIVHRHCTGPGCDIPADKCQIDHVWRYSDGGPTHPDNGQPQCGPHNRAREHPPRRQRRRQPTAIVAEPPGDPAAHLELLRARTRDRIQHDPTWGYNTDP